MSRETKFSGANGDRKEKNPCSADHEQNCQPYRLVPSMLYVIIVYTYNYTYNILEGISRA